MISAREALTKLQDGNRRFVAGFHDRRDATDPSRRRELVSGQGG